MAYILGIETATTVCSAAITLDGKIVVDKKLYSERSHANELTLLIQELMNEASISFQDLGAIALSEGPGSYTGLRIGTSTAKGLCYGLGLPLITVSTLKAMAFEVARMTEDSNALYAPMIDARRMEVYTALYTSSMKEELEPQPMILDDSSFEETLYKNSVFFFGDGSNKFVELASNKSAKFILDVTPSAWAICQLAELKHLKAEFSDLAYFEPQYLKAFQTTKPKKLL